jgi:RNA polymerase sigma-70 factor (ECF subfamily)
LFVFRTKLEIYNDYKSLVFNCALQYVQNREDAEEITQDVFLSVHDNLGNFKQNSKLSTWLYRITINKSIDFLKWRHRKKRYALLTNLFKREENLFFEPKEFNHPGVLLEDKEELGQLFALINSLPENQKTALILLKIEDLSQKEAAEVMQISTKALESLFQRAKINLEKMLLKAKENKK